MGAVECSVMVVYVYLEACLGGISLDLLSVDDNLDYSVPHLLTYVVSCVQLGIGGGERCSGGKNDPKKKEIIKTVDTLI